MPTFPSLSFLISTTLFLIFDTVFMISSETVPNLGNGATKPSRNWRLEESQKFTVAPAYNKGAYQVITKSNIKDIGK